MVGHKTSVLVHVHVPNLGLETPAQVGGGQTAINHDNVIVIILITDVRRSDLCDCLHCGVHTPQTLWSVISNHVKNLI